MHNHQTIAMAIKSHFHIFACLVVMTDWELPSDWMCSWTYTLGRSYSRIATDVFVWYHMPRNIEQHAEALVSLFYCYETSRSLQYVQEYQESAEMHTTSLLHTLVAAKTTKGTRKRGPDCRNPWCNLVFDSIDRIQQGTTHSVPFHFDFHFGNSLPLPRTRAQHLPRSKQSRYHHVSPSLDLSREQNHVSCQPPSARATSFLPMPVHIETKIQHKNSYIMLYKCI